MRAEASKRRLATVCCPSAVLRLETSLVVFLEVSLLDYVGFFENLFFSPVNFS